MFHKTKLIIGSMKLSPCKKTFGMFEGMKEEQNIKYTKQKIMMKSFLTENQY